MKLHGVYLDEETLNLAKLLGLTNVSDFVRDCLAYFVSGCDRELTRSEIRELSKKFALEKRAALQKQQKITCRSAEEKAKIEDIKSKRLAKIQEAVKTEIRLRGEDRFRKYFFDDLWGDYQSLQDDIIKAVSESSGYPVDAADVIAAYKAVQA